MKIRWSLVVAAGLLTAITVGFLAAQDRSAAQRQPDDQAIRAVAQAFARAFEKGDAQAVGALFTDEAEYIDEGGGEPIHGRAALGKAYADFFAKRTQLTAEAKTDKVRFLSKDTAIEDGTFTVKAKDRPADTSRYSVLYIRQDGRWLIAMLKEWGDDNANRPTLQDLGWLIGSWESEGPEFKATTTYEWAENKAFIRVRYTITPKKEGEKPMSGTQVIGIDPATGNIRGWTFDAEGGIGDATWAWDGERWVIDSTGTLANGAETTAENFLTRAGNDTFTWRSVKRTLNGANLPDLPTVQVKRVAAK